MSSFARVPDVSSRELHAICTIAEEGSFMAASLTLNLSQPALTRMVQRIEAAVGLSLFHRTTRRVEATPAGKEFIALASRVLADLRISFEGMREISDEERGRVVLSSVMSVAYTHLPRIVASYRGSRPGVEIVVQEGVHGAVLEDVRSGVADLGLGYLHDVPSDFSSIPFEVEAFYVVMPRRHPLGQHAKLTLNDLAGVPMVSLPRDAQTRRMLDGYAAIQSITLDHAVTVCQFATLMQFVHAGAGIAIVPGGTVPSAKQADLVVRPLVKPEMGRSLGVLMLKDRGLTPSARGFLFHLQDQWKQVGNQRSAAQKNSLAAALQSK